MKIPSYKPLLPLILIFLAFSCPSAVRGHEGDRQPVIQLQLLEDSPDPFDPATEVSTLNVEYAIRPIGGIETLFHLSRHPTHVFFLKTDWIIKDETGSIVAKVTKKSPLVAPLEVLQGSGGGAGHSGGRDPSGDTEVPVAVLPAMGAMTTASLPGWSGFPTPLPGMESLMPRARSLVTEVACLIPCGELSSGWSGRRRKIVNARRRSSARPGSSPAISPSRREANLLFLCP